MLFLVSAMFLSGCSKKPEFPVPAGVQTVRAVVQPVPFSLKRRGTHALIAPDGKMAAYAESTAVNLHALEGRDVQLEGIFEKNTDPSMLPVLVVSKVIEGGDEQTRPWVMTALGISMVLPRSWKGTIAGTTATFTASGYITPVLSITALQMVPPSAASGGMYEPPPLPVMGSPSSASELLVVGLRKAMADVSPDGSAWVVTVLPSSSAEPGKMLNFRFALREIGRAHV